MKSKIQIFTILLLVALVSCKPKPKADQQESEQEKVTQSENKKAKEFSKKTVDKWYKNLAESPVKVFENFDDEVYDIAYFHNLIEDENHHLKVYMGKKDNEYCLFTLVCKGELVNEGYVNLYDRVFKLSKGKTIASSKEELSDYVQGWVDSFPQETTVNFVKAFIIPNEDIDDIFEKTKKNHKMYITFGLKDKKAAKNDVAMVMSNAPKVKSNDQLKDPIDDPIYADLSTPCPAICANGELPD